ncbi:putative exocyst complex component Exo70, cullin repeat-like-containing domain-containing protein [Rosa chinensis]|uniref:Exocyst subunit Exo70 family protein n=1 Tax=Rosa chinensis TaxID=74649 RepID=A0A2P6SJZ7_ROSCH|nr:putative exocyst complex component Exo70, cullin repeat-like-containing domain-containing protein [Rosa chinensis]
MLVSETAKCGTTALPPPPRRGMSSLFFLSSNKNLSFSHYSLSSSFAGTTPSRTFSLSMMEENIENAEAIITKWDPSSSSYTKLTFVFQQSRKEAKEFLKAIKYLRSAMHALLGERLPSSKLVLAQNLMQVAMKRLEKEFYQILSTSRDQLDPESVSSRSSSRTCKFDDEEEGEARSEDELDIAGESITEVERVSVLAMSDLKSIADCMISSGYGKECAKIYKVIRKSMIDEGLYHLGIRRFKSSQIHKMDSEALENEINNWMKAAKIAVKTLFQGEKILCDHVFSASETIKESCFYQITKEGATTLFSFPELIVKNKKVPERIFGLMELHEAISDLWPETESVFSSESTSAIKLQALSLLLKLGDSVRSLLSDFESTIQKDSTKVLVPGGGIYPLTQKVMNYVTSLADYGIILSDILTDYPPPANSSFHETSFKSPMSDEGSTPAVSVHLAWLILVLLCKLDIKAEIYKDVGLAYLFLANNLHFIVEKVHHSPNLKLLLGEDWVAEHTKKVKLYASNYETTAWTKVLSSFPEKPFEMSSEMAKECFRRFNIAFEEAYRKQTSWIVEDVKLRDDLKVSIAQKLVPTYQEFYDTYLVMLTEEKNLELLVRFSPDDLSNYLSDLFHGTSTSVSSTASSSLPPRSCLPL